MNLHVLNTVFFIPQNAESQNITQSGDINQIQIRKVWYTLRNKDLLLLLP